jgi:hypothetical protein
MSVINRIHPGEAAPVSKAMLWAGRIMTALPALFLLMDGIMKLMKPEAVVKATVELGYPESVIMGLGIVLLVCVILYVVPRTAVLGAILLTGYLGGAIATHVRVGNHLFSHVLFPVYLGVLIWGLSTQQFPSYHAHQRRPLSYRTTSMRVPRYGEERFR